MKSTKVGDINFTENGVSFFKPYFGKPKIKVFPSKSQLIPFFLAYIYRRVKRMELNLSKNINNAVFISRYQVSWNNEEFSLLIYQELKDFLQNKKFTVRVLQQTLYEIFYKRNVSKSEVPIQFYKLIKSSNLSIEQFYKAVVDLFFTCSDVNQLNEFLDGLE